MSERLATGALMGLAVALGAVLFAPPSLEEEHPSFSAEGLQRITWHGPEDSVSVQWTDGEPSLTGTRGTLDHARLRRAIQALSEFRPVRSVERSGVLEMRRLELEYEGGQAHTLYLGSSSADERFRWAWVDDEGLRFAIHEDLARALSPSRADLRELRPLAAAEQVLEIDLVMGGEQLSFRVSPPSFRRDELHPAALDPGVLRKLLAELSEIEGSEPGSGSTSVWQEPFSIELRGGQSASIVGDGTCAHGGPRVTSNIGPLCIAAEQLAELSRLVSDSVALADPRVFAQPIAAARSLSIRKANRALSLKRVGPHWQSGDGTRISGHQVAAWLARLAEAEELEPVHADQPSDWTFSVGYDDASAAAFELVRSGQGTFLRRAGEGLGWRLDTTRLSWLEPDERVFANYLVAEEAFAIASLRRGDAVLARGELLGEWTRNGATVDAGEARAHVEALRLAPLGAAQWRPSTWRSSHTVEVELSETPETPRRIVEIALRRKSGQCLAQHGAGSPVLLYPGEFCSLLLGPWPTTR